MMINRNDLVPNDAPQKKLGWVTPKISLMEGVDTDGKSTDPHERGNANVQSGPS
jgi:hypothetical protein